MLKLSTESTLTLQLSVMSLGPIETNHGISPELLPHGHPLVLKWTMECQMKLACADKLPTPDLLQTSAMDFLTASDVLGLIILRRIVS